MRTRQRAFTLTELMIASAIGLMAGVGLMSLTVFSARMARSITVQQRAVQFARSATEGINAAVRPSSTPLRVLDDSNNAAISGNTVELAWPGEDLGRRTIRLVSDDDDLQTPWDNRLVYDPDTTVAGDEIVLAQWVTPKPNTNLFTYQGLASGLIVQLRIGDSLAAGMTALNDAHSGPGLQGADVNITVSPRN